MRELKFRAWHRNLQKYVQVSRYAVFSKDGEIYAADCDFEQFTGLRDKNGVEIYEGDIVSHKFGKELVKFETKGIFICGFCYEQFVGSGFMADGVLLGDKCEVIGNIYQNLELLDA